MMFLWMFARNPVLAREASGTLLLMLGLTFRDHGNRPYSKFFGEIVDHGIAPQDIYRAILYDMVDDVDAHGCVPNDNYDKMIAYASQFRLEDTITLNCHTEHALLWYSLAAGRRELCSGKIDLEIPEEQKFHHDNLCVTELCSYLW